LSEAREKLTCAEITNLNNVKRDASRHFRNKKKAYLKAKIEELEANSKINNISDLYRGINDFKKGYQPSTIIVRHEKRRFDCRLPQYYNEVEELFLPAIECTQG
jgi:hypothetical protein